MPFENCLIILYRHGVSTNGKVLQNLKELIKIFYRNISVSIEMSITLWPSVKMLSFLQAILSCSPAEILFNSILHLEGFKTSKSVIFSVLS